MEAYRILAVDDDPSILNIIETALSQEGYAVLTASDGNAACHLVEREKPHLIIMDVMMPQCNGILATIRIREESNVPILMLSAKAEGSGLGLAIAQTYTESVGGSFHVEIDGDQFAAIVTIPKNKSNR
ncbi:MAG: response regulator [Firmicutes bacterium]|nr:response regulator [Bacillota bacterium]